MVAVPAAMPFTIPAEPTDAIEGEDELHIPPGVALPKVIVFPVQVEVCPVIVSTLIA